MRFFAVLLLSLLIAALAPMTSRAAESVDDAVIVRIGLVDTVSSGQAVRQLVHQYSRSYLNEISKHTRWTFEYRTGTLEECMESLRQGELDLIGPVQRDESDGMLYSVGKAGYGLFSLYCRKDDVLYASGTADNVKGARIGILEEADLEQYLAFFVASNGWDVSIVRFSSLAAMMDAFHRGDIHMVVDDGTHVTEDETRLMPIGQTPECFMTNKEHASLMDKLNHAILTNENQYPFFQLLLQHEYIYSTLQIASPYREAEREFINHAPPLRAVFLPPHLPLYDAGHAQQHASGIYADYLEMIAAESGLAFDLVEADSPRELGEMLWSGEADIAFVVYSDGAHASTVSFTNTIDQELFVAVRARDSEGLPKQASVALPQIFSGMESFWRMRYPDWLQTDYHTVEECLEAVEQGECDIAFVPARYLQRENSMATHSALTTDDSWNQQIPISLAISPHQPGILREVLNTAILHLNRKQMDMIIHKNTEPVFSFNYVLTTYPLATAIALTTVAGILLMAGALFLRNHSRKQQNLILLQKNKALEEALRTAENMRIARDNYRAEAEVDKLTQLANKTTVQRVFGEEIQNLASDESMAIYVIDLDHFKEANDTFGHQYGDKVLVTFAAQLRHIFRTNDCVGRFGGDEFVVLLTGRLTKEVALRKAVQILHAARSLVIDGKTAKITASIGIAITSKQTTSYEEIFQQADSALYCVKENGRNGYCMEPPGVFH